MGGRGSSAGGGGGNTLGAGFSFFGTLKNLLKENTTKPVVKNTPSGGIATSPVGDYTANNNPALLKYQGQEDDKTARYLAGVYNKTDYSQYDDGKWGFYDNSYQKLVLSMNLNNRPTLLSEKDFNAYVNQTGAPVVYRGWSSSDSADRFTQSKYFHTGGGIYGDGIYFTTDSGTAASYGIGYGQKAITKMALAPTARVVSLADVQRAMGGASHNLRTALSKAGQSGQQNGYGGNSGESQMALKMGYNVIKVSDSYYVGLTADAFVVSKKRL